jgi:hypothetical protein
VRWICSSYRFGGAFVIATSNPKPTRVKKLLVVL